MFGDFFAFPFYPRCSFAKTAFRNHVFDEAWHPAFQLHIYGIITVVTTLVSPEGVDVPKANRVIEITFFGVVERPCQVIFIGVEGVVDKVFYTHDRCT